MTVGAPARRYELSVMAGLDPAISCAARCAAIALALAVGACERPPVVPFLDDRCAGNSAGCAAATISGTLTYSGPVPAGSPRAIVLLFPLAHLPPPDGTDPRAANVAVIDGPALFGGAFAPGTFSAAYAFPLVEPGTYRVYAFLDASGTWDPFALRLVDQLRAGDVAGGHVDAATGRALDVAVASGQALSGVGVLLGAVAAREPPAFRYVDAPPALVPSPSGPTRFAIELDPDAADAYGFLASARAFDVSLKRGCDGAARDDDLDGLPDAWPLVVLKQTKDELGVTPAQPAIVPVAVDVLPTLPLLAQPDASAPETRLGLSASPFAVHLAPAADACAPPAATLLAEIPPGEYELDVATPLGQAWRVPNELAPLLPAQGAVVRVTRPDSSPGIAGAVTVSPPAGYAGPPSGNVVLLAFAAARPPPPAGTGSPLGVAVVPKALVAAGHGTAPFRIASLAPGDYLVIALYDPDASFGPERFRATITSRDLVSAPTPVTVPAAGDGMATLTVGQPPTLRGDGTGPALDPPAFRADTGPTMSQDAHLPAHFHLRAHPLSPALLPAFAGREEGTTFTAQLVLDARGHPVDANGDGLPDLLPRVFVRKLADDDAAGLRDETRPIFLPAAVNPLPLLPLLAGGARVATTDLDVVVQPLAVDLSDPAHPTPLPELPAGRYSLTVVNATGQSWRTPNELGADALEAAAAALSPDARTQSLAFTVTPGAGASAAITGFVDVAPVASAGGLYVFAFDPKSLPPPYGSAAPVAAFALPQPAWGAVVASQHGAAKVHAPFSLTGLAPGAYVAQAFLDVAGTFSGYPALLATPGKGALASLPTPPLAVPSPEASTVQLTLDQTLPLGPPSFAIVDAAGTPLTGAVDGGALATGPLTLNVAVADPSALLAGFPSTQGTTAADAFGFQSTGQKTSALPDVGWRAVLVRLDDADPTHLAPSTPATLVQGELDTLPLVPQFAQAAGQGRLSALRLVFPPASAVFARPGQPPVVSGGVPPGDYALALVASSSQFWRVPNALAPALLDPRAVPLSSTASQGVVVHVPATPPPGATLSGHVTVAPPLSGTVFIAAYRADDPPPPQGTGRPVAATLLGPGALSPATPYQLAVPPGRYLVQALLDLDRNFNPFFDALAGATYGDLLAAYAPGGVPAVVDTSAGVSADLVFAPQSPSATSERPMFAVDASTPPRLSLSSGQPGIPLVVDLAFPTDGVLAPSATHAGFVVRYLDLNGDGVVDQSPLGGNLLWPRALLKLRDASRHVVLLAGPDERAYASSLTTRGQPDLTKSLTVSKLALVVSRQALDLDRGAIVTAPVGDYALTLVNPSGQTWTVPNELAETGDVAQGALFQVAP